MNRNGKPVRDAEAPLILNIRPRDVKNAVSGDPRNCAIAQCIKRHEHEVLVSVGATVVLVESEECTTRYVLRNEDRKMIHAFDQVRYFRPGEIVLLPPPPKRRIGARRGTPPGSNRRTGRARTAYNAPKTRHLGRPG